MADTDPAVNQRCSAVGREHNNEDYEREIDLTATS